MSSWSAEQILRALKQLDAAEMSDDVERIVTAEYELVRFPQRLLSPTFPAAQVLWSDFTRPFDAVFEEVARTVQGWNLDAVHWWVTSATRPKDTESQLVLRGGERSDTFLILARDLAGDTANPRVDEGVTVELVRDERTLRDAVVVETLGWGRSDAERRDTRSAAPRRTSRPGRVGRIPSRRVRERRSDGHGSMHDRWRRGTSVGSGHAA